MSSGGVAMSLVINAAAVAGVLSAVAVCVVPTASARTYEHARQVGKRCSTCHASKAPHVSNLNSAGRYFLEHRTLDGYDPRPAAGRGRTKPSTAQPVPGGPPGLVVFNRTCLLCHGPAGKGTALATPLTAQRKHATTEAAAVEVITNGIKGTTMAPFKGTLTEREIRDVAKYVMTLQPARSGK
jgi:mono/diheme cytochrome c family protein